MTNNYVRSHDRIRGFLLGAAGLTLGIAWVAFYSWLRLAIN